MNRYYNERDDDDLEAEFRELGFQDSDSSESDEADEDDEANAKDLDRRDAPPPEYSTGEHGVEVSMEVDEDGNEVWYAEDSQVPGSTSMGHSVEEAVEGVEDRRRLYREIKRRSREERKRRKPEE